MIPLDKAKSRQGLITRARAGLWNRCLRADAEYRLDSARFRVTDPPVRDRQSSCTHRRARVACRARYPLCGLVAGAPARAGRKWTGPALWLDLAGCAAIGTANRVRVAGLGALAAGWEPRSALPRSHHRARYCREGRSITIGESGLSWAAVSQRSLVGHSYLKRWPNLWAGRSTQR
jgi:hypothetical protein